MSNTSNNSIEELVRALAFLDACRNDPSATETGARRDAMEWLECAAREVVSELRDPITAYYADRASSGQAALTAH